MIITYFRSSSFNAHSMCEQQYFGEYVLGWRGLSGKKADKGTIVHKILEILAFIKKAEQNNQITIVDDVVGELDVNNYDLDTIIEQVYDYYTSTNQHHKWMPVDKKDCREWVYKTLNYNNGMFDPRKRHIVEAEQHFDFEIKKPWSKYSFTIDDQEISGHLALKGTIDLITKVNDNTLEIIDWNTGKRLNWATGKTKEQEDLEKDPQLRIYHYALTRLYPEIDHVIVSINFINDGGAFSICFDKKDLIATEDMLRQKFEIIKKSKKPKLTKSWMCSKLCHLGKTTFENTAVPPLVEYRDGQISPKDKHMTKCEQIKHDIELYDIQFVTQQYKHPNHNFGFYKPPGQT